MKCKLTSNITKENCQYQVAGVKAVYLINFDMANKYTFDENGDVDTITLGGDDAHVFKVEFIDGTASWTDDLAVNGNGGKYRTHTLNFTLSDYEHKVLNQGNALSLGKFTAIVVDKSNNSVILGRQNGLSATSFNYASGAADADANGWTTVLAGTEIEIGKKLTDISIISSLVAADDPSTRIVVLP